MAKKTIDPNAMFGLNDGKKCPRCKSKITYYMGRDIDGHKCMSCGNVFK